MTSEQALESLKNGDIEALGWIYERYRENFVKSMINRLKYSPQEAISLFHDVIVEFDRQVQQGRFTELKGAGLGGWFYQTGLNKAKEEERRRKRELTHDLNHKEQDVSTDYIEKEEMFTRLEKELSELDEDCQKLLKLYYLDQKPLDQIWQSLQFPSYNAAKTCLYRCREKLKKRIFTPPKN